MKLMIIESPGKIAKLTAILGAGWKVAASVGHVRDLPVNEIGVQAPAFDPSYRLTERGASVVARLKSLVRDADAVYLASDPDREGEAISWHLQACLKLSDAFRVTFNEITPGAVTAALLQPRAIDRQRVAAQEARRVLDRLVGYIVSPELSTRTGQRLSAGRVQSPAVRLVVERERQIKAFRRTEHFGAMLVFASAGGEWSAQWQTKPDFVSESSPYFMERAFAEAIASIESVTVRAFAETEARRSPPPPFTTSMMQQVASTALGLDPKQAMAAAQGLYEQGHITYHRTDNPNVSKESLPDIAAVVDKLGLKMTDVPRRFKAQAEAQEGHPAITPTHWQIEDVGESPDQRALYKLIRLRAVACQLADARYTVRTATLQAIERISGKRVEFEARGRTLTDPGWLRLPIRDDDEEDEDRAHANNPIAILSEGDTLNVARGKLLVKKTLPPNRYTQATLVRTLEAEGIGRPATYAAILDNIVSRDYVRSEKKFLVPTPTGDLIVDSLVGRFEFIELPFTRQLEQDLDRIAQGGDEYRAVVQRVYARLQGELAALQASTSQTLACSACGKPLIRRFKAGKGGYDFFGCTGYRDGCKESYPNDCGKPGARKARRGGSPSHTISPNNKESQTT